MCNLWNVRHDKWEDLQETLKTRRKLQITTIFSAYYNDLFFLLSYETQLNVFSADFGLVNFISLWIAIYMTG